MSRICVKNLSPAVGEDLLRTTFSSRGEVTDCRIVKTKLGKNRRFAFVGFRSEDQATDAVRYFNNTYILTNKVIVELAARIGDESVLQKSRSRITQSKVKKMSKIEDAARHEELQQQLEAKKQQLEDSKSKKPVDKRKLDFIEAMKARRNAKFWGNDEGQQAVPTAVPEVAQEGEENQDSDEEAEYAEVDAASTGEEDVARDETLSDMEYLRRKMVPSAPAAVPAGAAPVEAVEEEEPAVEMQPEEEELDEDRLFVRNLPYQCSEEELRSRFEAFGAVTAVHMPLNEDKRCKGYGYVQFMLPEHADRAVQEMHGSSFQGRVLHVVKAKHVAEAAPETAGTRGRLSSYQQKKEEDRRKLLGKKEGWNASFVRSDAVIDSLAEKYGVDRADILDTTEGGGELAIRLAMGETHILQANREFFLANGVDLGALESITSNRKAEHRSTTTLLIKNLPHNLVAAELEDMFSKYGNLSSFLVPPSKTIALIDFIEPSEARAAFKGLSYRKYKHVPLYLEWAPQGVIASKKKSAQVPGKPPVEEKPSEQSGETEEEFSSLFIKNLSFSSSDDALTRHIASLGCSGLRVVSIPKKKKGELVLSMGYGFAEFQSPGGATKALKKLHGSVLDGHSLEVKPSDKRISASNATKSKRPLLADGDDKNTKLIVRNVAFQASTDEIKNLFSAFGAVKRVRIPKKLGNVHRGFAFVEFSSAQEAANAMASLIDTHLYGRHLVLEWAKEGDDDMEQLRKKAKTEANTLLKASRVTGKIDDIVEQGKGSALSDDEDDS